MLFKMETLLMDVVPKVVVGCFVQDYWLLSDQDQKYKSGFSYS